MAPDYGAVARSGCDKAVRTHGPRGTEAFGSKFTGDKLCGEAPIPDLKTAPPGPSGATVSRRPQRQTVMPELSSQRHQDSEVSPKPPGFFLSDVRYTVLEFIKWSPSH